MNKSNDLGYREIINIILINTGIKDSLDGKYYYKIQNIFNGKQSEVIFLEILSKDLF